MSSVILLFVFTTIGSITAAINVSYYYVSGYTTVTANRDWVYSMATTSLLRVSKEISSDFRYWFIKSSQYDLY